MVRFYPGRVQDCPYYRFGDEYQIVKKTDLMRKYLYLRRSSFKKIRHQTGTFFPKNTCFTFT